MPILVIGGHTRSVGKTSVVAGLIAALPAMHWTALKITQYGHGVCSANGAPCDCATADHSFAVSEEKDRSCLLYTLDVYKRQQQDTVQFDRHHESVLGRALGGNGQVRRRPGQEPPRAIPHIV